MTTEAFDRVMAVREPFSRNAKKFSARKVVTNAILTSSMGRHLICKRRWNAVNAMNWFPGKSETLSRTYTVLDRVLHFHAVSTVVPFLRYPFRSPSTIRIIVRKRHASVVPAHYRIQSTNILRALDTYQNLQIAVLARVRWRQETG